MINFAAKFNLDISFVNKFWNSALESFHTNSGNIFDIQHLKYFSYTQDKLIDIRNRACKDPDNLMYCWLLRQALLERNVDAITALGSPNALLNDELYDTLPLFALLSLVPDMVENHKKLNIPEVITKATLGMFENQLQESLYVLNKFGISAYTAWMSKFLYSEIIRIGRLNFEICKFEYPYEAYLSSGRLYIFPNDVPFHQSGQVLGSIGCECTENSFTAEVTQKNDYVSGFIIKNGICTNEKIMLQKPSKVLSYNDFVVNVHIPFDGPLTPEVCDRDFATAYNVIRRSYGDFSAFMCYSWLLDPQLERIAGKKTNITAFGDRFSRFPLKNNGSEVFEYLFKQPHSTPPTELKITSGFSKKVKEHLESGGHIYSTGGIFMTDRYKSQL